MGNPRSTVDFTDIGRLPATYIADGVTIVYDRTKANGSDKVGRAVMLTGNKTVALTSDGAAVEGILENVEPDGKVGIKAGGYGEAPGGAGAALTPGKKFVGAVGAGGAGDRGYIREAANAADALVARGSIVDSSDPTMVTVRL